MIRLISFALVGVLSVGLLGCKTKAPPKPAAPAAPPPSVKAGDLMDEYAKNAVAADGKYKGKMLKVTGKFNTAQKAPLLGYSVMVLPENAGDVNLTGVQCFILPEAEEEVGKMQAGQMVSFEGMCDGQTLGQVKLSKCVVVK